MADGRHAKSLCFESGFRRLDCLVERNEIPNGDDAVWEIYVRARWVGLVTKKGRKIKSKL